MSSAPADKLVQERPWERPWWQPSPGNYLTFLFIASIHILAAVGLILFPLPSWQIALASLVLAFMGGLGTTVCYHRSLSHKALKLNIVVEQILVFFTIINGNSAPLGWVANHRHHHTKADTIEDVSSPRHGGFWWAHLRWVYQWPQSDIKRWCPDLDRPRYRFWTMLAPLLIVVALLGGLAISWEAFFWLGAIRLVYSLHGQMFVNSLLHMSPEAPMGQESSRNIWWLGPFQLGAWGENWHFNHHNNSSTAKFSRHWAQIDIGWYTIWVLERLRLASHVRRP